ncbi:hypothetical protein [Flavobacterium pedocola]
MKTKKIFRVGFLLVFLNGILYFGLLPFIQKSANSHMSAADFFTILISLVAIVCLVVAVIRFLMRKSNLLTYSLLLFAVNLILWLPKIYNIECEGCAMSG